MIIRKNGWPAGLSFLLPGLGQLYGGHPIRALVFFMGFIALHWLDHALIFAPLSALWASWDAYRLPAPHDAPIPEGRKARARGYLFATVGIICFLSWFSHTLRAFFPRTISTTAIKIRSVDNIDRR